MSSSTRTAFRRCRSLAYGEGLTREQAIEMVRSLVH